MKTGTEGIAIATALLSLIWVIPRVQSVYQWAQSQRLAELFDSDSLFPGSTTSETNRPQKVASKPALSYRTEDEFTEETDVLPTEAADDVADEPIPTEATTLAQDGAGSASLGPSTRSLNAKPQEVWRFNLRAASLTDAELAVQSMLRAPTGPLQDSDIPAAFRAPGGIQFDLLLDSRWISPLQDSLRTFIEKNRKTAGNESDPNSAPSSDMTWFRNRSKAPLPPGKARVIIWISQF